MAYGQWIVLLITNSIETQIRVQNANLAFGKFYRGDDKDVEVSAAEVDMIGIPWGVQEEVHSCGRSDSASGTEGFVDLYDEATRICRIYWNCPWATAANDLSIQDYDMYSSPYAVETRHGDLSSGPIGHVFVNVTLRD